MIKVCFKWPHYYFSTKRTESCIVICKGLWSWRENLTIPLWGLNPDFVSLGDFMWKGYPYSFNLVCEQNWLVCSVIRHMNLWVEGSPQHHGGELSATNMGFSCWFATLLLLCFSVPSCFCSLRKENCLRVLFCFVLFPKI